MMNDDFPMRYLVPPVSEYKVALIEAKSINRYTGNTVYILCIFTAHNLTVDTVDASEKPPAPLHVGS